MERTLVELARMVRQGEVTASTLVDQALRRADAHAALNAFITLDRDGARSKARRIDEALVKGHDAGPLAGVPVVVKDNINVAGLRTTAGTPGIELVAETSAPIVARLEAAQAIVIGKTNLHELAFGVTSNNAAYGAVRNAVDPARFPGGSSGGTATAIAACIVPAGLGTDTGGSVRQPAALCGVVGFRPTTGRVDQDGVVPSIPTLDVVGPMARTVADVALLNAVMNDSSLPGQRDAGSLRLGIARPQAEGLSTGVAGAFGAAVSRLRQGGATLIDVDLSAIVAACFEIGFSIGFHEMNSAMKAFLARYQPQTSLKQLVDQIASPDVKAVYVTSVVGDGAPTDAVYGDAIGRIASIRRDYLKLLDDFGLDAVIFPTAPLEAQPIEGSEATVVLNGQVVSTLETYIRNNASTGVYGAPGLSIPIGKTGDGLPVGLEIDGRPDGDIDVLAIGQCIEALLATD
ncbi:MAG: amidase family protein [Pseudomonadota bacterium]